jgi:hypothetical protein
VAAVAVGAVAAVAAAVAAVAVAAAAAAEPRCCRPLNHRRYQSHPPILHLRPQPFRHRLPDPLAPLVELKHLLRWPLCLHWTRSASSACIPCSLSNPSVHPWSPTATDPPPAGHSVGHPRYHSLQIGKSVEILSLLIMALILQKLLNNSVVKILHEDQLSFCFLSLHSQM